MARSVRHEGARTPRLRHEIGQAIRQLVAVLLSLALPGTSLPADSLRPVSSGASQTRSLHALVPPGGLDAFTKTPGRRAGSRSPAVSVKTGAAYSSVASNGMHNALRSPATLTMSRPRLAPPAPPSPPNLPSNTSTITSNFNGTSIAAGNYIWFNSVMNVSGVPSTGATITVSGATVQFTANSVAYNLPVPDSVITFSSSVSTSTTSFDAVHNQWNATVPVSYTGNVFLAGLADQLSTALPGGINPVTWTATFYTDKSGVSLQWQWAAAVYTSFSANYSALGVKPIDATSGSAYPNSDHAGTPENYKSYVIGGAQGGGGSNWTGSYSGTASVTPQVAPNHAPVANAGANQTVFVGTTVQLNGTASSDPNGLRITYSWSLVSIPAGSGTALSGATGPLPTFLVDKSGSYTVQLIVSDGELSSAPSQVVISTKNSPPVANAGPNQTVTAGTTVQLNGSGSSDVDGDSLTYRWSIVSAPTGSTATLSNSGIVNPTFVPNAKGTYVVQLIVNDGIVDSSPSQVTISSTNSAPVANAGPNQILVAGTTVHLDGSGSTDVDGDPLTYSWAILSTPQESSAALSSATIVNPTFFADKSGTYVVQLIVNDGTVNSQPSTVTITSQNAPPIANAGANQTVTTHTTVQLDGSKSTDVDGDSLTYQWSIVSAPTGSTASLSNPTIVNPTFSTDEKGTYVIQLIVNDGVANSAPSEVTISDINSPPVANPGPNQTINVATTVQLDGSHSTDVDGDLLTYSWAILSTPTGSTAVLSSATAVQPTFVADRVGTYVIQLIVNDGTVNSQPATVTISTNDVPPVANPGPAQSVTVGTVVTLDGSGSTDSDGLSLTYQWTLLSAPAGSTAVLTSTTTVTTSLTADLPGNYVTQLIVNDGFLSSPPATVTISTSDVPPVANPGPNQTVSAGATVQLDGTGSTDSDRQPLTYRWAILSQPSSGNATLSSATAANPTFVAALAGLYVVQLIVNDGFLDSAPATMTVTVRQTNLPPTVSAGPDQTIELPNSATLNGSATSTAPPGSPVTVQWTQISGPGTVTFASPTSPVTQATFSVAGKYVVQLTGTVTASGLSASAQATITVEPINQPPVVTVGPDQTIVFPVNTANLTGTVTDDGFPIGSTLQISWSKVVGPGTVTFLNAAQPNTQATFSLPGNYILRLSASDGQYTASGTMRVAFTAPGSGGLTVTAGSDQVIVFPNSATLNGSAVDSTPGSMVAVGWSLVSGPGTASFANSASLSTSVTFSAPGVYDLRLTASDGTFIATSDLKIYAGNVQCTLSNKGTDFWLMFIGAIVIETTSTPPRQLSLFISSDVATSGTVSVPGQQLTFPFSVTPGQIATVNLPQSVQVTSSDLVEGKGIHVTAQNPVAVYGLNFVPFASDAYMGLPTNTLGTSYYIASYRQTSAPFQGLTEGTEFGVTATQDNTNVTIVPTSKAGARPARVPFTVQLNQGQSYQLRNDTDFLELTPNGLAPGAPIDLTGSLVTSDKPVAVFGGHDCTRVPEGIPACNHLVEQMPPVNLWGQNFVTMPLFTENKGDFFRFVAQADNTHVQVNHQEVAVLLAGQFFEQLITGPAEISTDQPILTVQYAASSNFTGNQFVDPSMIVVPPFEQFGGNYTVNSKSLHEAQGSDFPSNYINVIAPTLAAQASAVVMDGTAIPPLSFRPIGTSPFSGAQITVAEGPHVFTSNVPFGVWAYGFNTFDAYGYTGGVCFSKGVPNGSLTASPKTSTNQITSQVTIQATVVDSTSQPVGGAGVTFAVTGVNPQTGSATTNSSGVASFTFTGFNKGSDLVTVTSGTASDTANLTWISNGPNQPPVVSAGPNRTISLPVNSVFLAGSVIDDGLPAGGTLTIQWSQTGGPAGVSFTTPNQAQTSASFPQAGIYVLQLTANDSQLSSSSSVTVTVLAANAPPVVSAGPNRTFVWLLNTFMGTTLTGTASDDGLPAGSTLTVAWSQLSGPGPVTFSSPNAVSTSVTLPSPGLYAFRLSASDGQFTSTSDTTVNALGPLALTVTSPQSIPTSPGGAPFAVAASAGTPVQLTANATLNGQPVDNRFAFSWGADIGSMTFSSPSSATTDVTYSGTGTNYLVLTVSFTPVPGDSTSTIVQSSVIAAVTSAPAVSISAPAADGEVTNLTQIVGTVSAGNYTLDYARQDDLHPLSFTTFATGTGPANGPLGTFDPTLLLNGSYVIRLTTLNGSFEASTSVNVNVTRNVKVGVFTVSFNDLTVPVTGIPLQVIRTYDSRDKGQGDFGVGWRLSLADVRLQKSRNLGLGWQESVTLSGPFQIPTYCLDSTTSKVVTVTFPGGKVYRFQAQNSLECQNFGPIIAPVLSFTQLSGPASTAGATLTPADGGQAVLDGSIPGPQNFFGFDGNVYNPTAFVLKTADGTRYTIDQKLGLTAVTDPNGNTLTITTNGIISSAGKSIPFARDEQGRITRITDPDGNVLRYSYDPATGNLLSYRDRTNSVTGYLYDSLHDLLEIVTADNNIVLTNNYDANGRLVNTNDGLGHRVNFTHNIAAQTEVVQDRNGHSTTYAYDADGNVIQTTDALGNISSATYDANDNKLTETNALGKTSIYTYDDFGNRLTEKDPLGNTTTYTYNALNKPLTITDANNNVTTNTYDTLGNLLTTKDPLGNVTTNAYFPNGTLKSTQDALQHTSSFTYDGTGNLVTQTDTNGTVTSYAYDANGNRTSQSVTRTTANSPQTLITTYVYDGNNRLVKTINPDSTTTQVIYNSVGQQVQTIDALNHKTSFSYDNAGHLAFTTYPDNSNDATTYDNNGNRTQYQARGGGLTTNYTYDALNRLTQTQNVITGTTKTSYDAAGQVLTTTDANGNVTTYTYDDAGRRNTVVDALNDVTTFGYDAAGNQTTIKDANNNITTFTYDGSNRRTKVTYPDGKLEGTGYDALGRVTSRTDANGVITQYNYDPLGRLISVVQDAAPGGQNLLTSYTYDEVGNRLTQTDANAHTTGYVYDQRGRRTQRALPLGQSESYVYDAVGNLKTRTDFNGKTTAYTYNVMNQLLSKIPDPSFNAVPVTFTYEVSGANIGMRLSMTDASGTTNYTNNGTRLVRRDSPVGTVTYSYDAPGNVLTVRSQTFTSTIAGTAITYTYDKLNRLSTVATSYSSILAGTPANGSTTTYNYDNVGNLKSITYPNGVVHNYAYDTRNRLTNLGVNGTVSGAPGAIAGYTYTLDAAGHRTGVTELSGRTVGYTYDNLYRLTSETIASDPNAINGAVSYTYDAVGNRKQMTSTLAPVPAGLFNYDANDRFTLGDTYDNNGNTVSSGGIANVYDFENHLIQQGGVSIKYDGDGNRLFKTVAGVTTGYLLDDRSPTGYVQVLDEVQGPSITRSYVYGLELIEQDRINTSTLRQSTSYNVYDGHGSVRALTDLTGTVTDTYDYDAFGNIVHSTGTTPNVYLFAGEQFDPDLHLYYNRARYLNVSTGRFWTMDTYEGDDQIPLSVHKYLYAQANPVDNTDHSGNQIDDVIGAIEVGMTINVMPTLPATVVGTVLRGLPYQVVVVSASSGRTYEPESVVKNSAQARVAGVPVGTAIRIAVPPGINPQTMVDEWSSRSAWNPQTWLDFKKNWSDPANNFKVSFGAIYDAYGNFEFGATGAAAGFSVATLELAADLVHGGTNDPINQTDIASGFYAIKDGGKLSTKQEKLVP